MRLLIVGAGSFSCEAEEIALACGYDEVGFVDDNPDKAMSSPVVGSMKDIPELVREYDSAIVALGNNANRMKYHTILRDCGCKIATLIHPQAFVSEKATVGKGSIIRCYAYVGCHAVIGEACVLNVGAKVDHHCAIGDGCHLQINSVVRSSKSVEPMMWLGCCEVVE